MVNPRFLAGQHRGPVAAATSRAGGRRFAPVPRSRRAPADGPPATKPSLPRTAGRPGRVLSERRFDAVVETALEMPRLDGFQLIARIRREATLRGLPIVVLSSRTSQGARDRALAAGANVFLPKSRHRRSLVAAVAACLLQREDGKGCSIRATVRVTGVAKNTVTNLFVDLGAACEAYQVEHLVNLPCKRIQCDEIWSFVGAKQKNVNEGAQGVGDVWTWTAIDADASFIASWLVGDRGGDTAKRFISDLAGRLASRVQLTTDGHKVYLNAIENRSAMTSTTPCGQAVRRCHAGGEVRYSPATCTGPRRRPSLEPREEYVSTSYVERQNLTMRMSIVGSPA